MNNLQGPMITNRYDSLDKLYKKFIIKEISFEGIIYLLQESKELGLDITSSQKTFAAAKKSFDRLKNKVFFSKLKEKDKLHSQLKNIPYKERVYLQLISRECIPKTVVPLITKMYTKDIPFSLEQLVFLNRSTDKQISALFADDLYTKRIKKRINERSGN